MAYFSKKHYGHNIGLSAVFRQPNADHSHCNLLHGYSLAFTFTFGCTDLDDKNWAVDFGGLKSLKQWLEDNFDHKTAIDKDDPFLDKFMELEELGLAKIVVMDGVGAEKFAEHAWKAADDIVRKISDDRCFCVSVECAEHASNSAIYDATK
jgi:6-pyruvoyltetrahydropterin/6-carboxytetrahydropterin synthase